MQLLACGGSNHQKRKARAGVRTIGWTSANVVSFDDRGGGGERMMMVVNGGECDDLVMVVSWW